MFPFGGPFRSAFPFALQAAMRRCAGLKLGIGFGSSASLIGGDTLGSSSELFGAGASFESKSLFSVWIFGILEGQVSHTLMAVLLCYAKLPERMVTI